MNLPQKKIERKLFSRGYDYIIAVDEVGMGCLAGPVAVCAVLLDKKFFSKKYKNLTNLKESKLLNKNQREHFSKELKNLGIQYQICYAYPKTIDKVNIYQAARGAMKRAVERLKTKESTMVLVDGKTKIKDLELEQTAIIKGDRKVFSIACASIIAKVFRDKMMARYAKKYPHYGFEKHMGYGTKHHITQLTALGPCAIHRRSFRLEYK